RLSTVTIVVAAWSPLFPYSTLFRSKPSEVTLPAPEEITLVGKKVTPASPELSVMPPAPAERALSLVVMPPPRSVLAMGASPAETAAADTGELSAPGQRARRRTVEGR